MIQFPPRKILVPFDLSRASEVAWKHACALAQRFSSALEVLYVEDWLPLADVLPPPALTPQRRRQLIAMIREKLGSQPRIIILQGEPTVSILRWAKLHPPDLIVMGNHGRKGLERVWAGSVSEIVARLSPVPVYCARGPARAVRSVLAPVNFKDYSDYGFTYAAGVAASFHARLTAVHVAPSAGDLSAKSKLSRLLARIPEPARKASRASARLIEGKIPQAIIEEGQRAGVIVIAAHRKTALADAVLGTTAERVLRHSTVPVLAVPAPPRAFATGHWELGAARRRVTWISSTSS